jgi:hypothetical protein
MSNVPKRPPILLRRQSRPAPSHGPSHSPRPELTVPARPKPSVAKPKPKPKPEPPPATPKLPLPATGWELPNVPLMAADVPSGTIVRLGNLVCGRNRETQRPYMMLCVACPHCRGRKHFYPWRADWPVTRAVRSRQRARCPRKKGGAVWLALDPERLVISQQASLEGFAAYQEWKTWWQALTPQERSSIRKAYRASTAERSELEGNRP